MLLKDLIKRKEHKYVDEIYFDSLSTRKFLINYPLIKFFVSDNIDENKLVEQIKLHAIDFMYRSFDKLYLVCVAFHSVSDFENFNDELKVSNNFDITLKNAYDIFN